MRLQFWAADTLRFSVTGPEPHRFLNRAAAGGRAAAARPLAAGRLCGYGQRCRPPPVGENRAGRRLDAWP